MKENLSKKLAKLANLKLTLQEEERLGIDIAEILEYVGNIRKLRLKRVKPMSHILNINNVMRPDIARENRINTPKYFKCKKII